MKRILALAVFAAAHPLSAADEGPAMRTAEVSSPTRATNATAPSLVAAADGRAWLIWREGDHHRAALKFSTYDAALNRWLDPRTIASGENWCVNAADFPTITVGARGATAVWSVGNAPAPSNAPAQHEHDGPGCHAVVSTSRDGGKSWSAPAPLTNESTSVEFSSLVTLADGRVLAAWLDGRAKQAGAKTQQLFARIVGTGGPDVLVDGRVCDCCQLALTAFPNGSALLAYRGRSGDEVRDIRVARFRGNRWEEPRPLNNDDWRIDGCPVNGPHLSTDGGRVAVAWFTAADNDPRVNASFSPDAGARFLMPLRLSETKPLGRVATALLHDGAFLVSFVDAEGAVWLRRVTPDFAAATQLRLSEPRHGRVKGFPRMALVRDYDGGTTAAELLVAFTQEGAGLRTVRVTVPEGDLLAAEKNCDCMPTADQLRGFPIRGTIVAAPVGDRVRIEHFEVPGIFGDGTREFRAPPEVLARAREPGRQFLGRIERRGADWWLIDLRLIATAPR